MAEIPEQKELVKSQLAKQENADKLKVEPRSELQELEKRLSASFRKEVAGLERAYKQELSALAEAHNLTKAELLKLQRQHRQLRGKTKKILEQREVKPQPEIPTPEEIKPAKQESEERKFPWSLFGD